MIPKLPSLQTFKDEVIRKIRELDHNSSDEEIEEWFECEAVTERHMLGEFTDNETTDFAHAFCSYIEESEQE